MLIQKPKDVTFLHFYIDLEKAPENSGMQGSLVHYVWYVTRYCPTEPFKNKSFDVNVPVLYTLLVYCLTFQLVHIGFP